MNDQEAPGPNRQRPITDNELKATIYFAVGVASEGSLRGSNVAYDLSVSRSKGTEGINFGRPRNRDVTLGKYLSLARLLLNGRQREIGMVGTKAAHQMRWFVCGITALLFNAACSSQVRATQAETTPQKTPISSASDEKAKLVSGTNAHADVSNDSDKEQSWLSDCLRDQGGSRPADASCYSRYQDQLESAQAKLLQEIQTALSKQGPNGADYTAAAKLLDISQRDWKSYTDADCEMLSKVFGDGNAQGLASGECIMAHYEDRNEKLRELKQSYLEN